MNSLLIEAIDKLQAQHNRVLLDAVGTCAVKFEKMSDNGNDSLYSEPARKWRTIEHRIKNVNSNDDELSEELSNDELEWVVAAYLWCSVLNETTCFTTD